MCSQRAYPGPPQWAGGGALNEAGTADVSDVDPTDALHRFLAHRSTPWQTGCACRRRSSTAPPFSKGGHECLKPGPMQNRRATPSRTSRSIGVLGTPRRSVLPAECGARLSPRDNTKYVEPEQAVATGAAPCRCRRRRHTACRCRALRTAGRRSHHNGGAPLHAGRSCTTCTHCRFSAKSCESTGPEDRELKARSRRPTAALGGGQVPVTQQP